MAICQECREFVYHGNYKKTPRHYCNKITGVCERKDCNFPGHNLTIEGSHRKCENCGNIYYVLDDFAASGVVFWCGVCD